MSNRGVKLGSKLGANRGREPDLHPTCEVGAFLMVQLGSKLGAKLRVKLVRSWPTVKRPILSFSYLLDPYFYNSFLRAFVCILSSLFV